MIYGTRPETAANAACRPPFPSALPPSRRFRVRYRIPLLLLCAFLPARADEPSPAEAKARQDAAERILQFAGWCAFRGARTAGTEAWEEAKDLDPAARSLAGIEKSLADAGDALDAAALAKQRKDAGKEIAKSLDRLAALKHDAKDDARFQGWLARSLSWDPSEARIRAALAAADQAGTSRPDDAGRLLHAVELADPEGAAKGKYDALAVKFAQKDLVLLGSPDHPLMAYVSLPKGWKKGGTWPVLVAVDGAGCGFLGCGRGFATTRGSRGVIVVSPMTLSNTNTLEASKYPVYPRSLLKKWDGNRIEFDGRGVEGILSEVRRRFGGEEKVFVTGFSGGGNYCYYKLLADPKGVRGAAPCCANFGGYGADGAPGAGAGGGPPVHIFTGEKDEHREFTFGKRDSPGIEPQTDKAVEVLEGLGYAHIERTMVPGSGHSPLREKVWEFVDEVLGEKK